MYVSGLDGFIWLLLNTNWKLHNGIAKVSLVHQMLMPTNTKWKFYLKSTNRNTLNGGTIDIYVEVWIHERALLLQEHWCHKLLNSSWHCVSYANVSGKGSLILPLGRILIICLFSCLKVWKCRFDNVKERKTESWFFWDENLANQCQRMIWTMQLVMMSTF